MITSRIDHGHIARALAGCALLLQLAACNHIEEEPIDEPAGSAEYFLDNRTDHSLTIDWTRSPQLGGETRRAGPVAPGQVLAFEEDGIIGVNPLPVDTFASLRLEDPDRNLVYVQDPIDNDAWVVERTDTGDYGHANITLVIANADLSAPGATATSAGTQAAIRSGARAPTR